MYNNNNNRNVGRGITPEGWLRGLRFLAAIGGAIAMYASANFSVMGFSLDAPDLKWLGWVLAALIIVTEFVWRKPGMENNLTMALVGMCAYAYGIFTNLFGILFAMGVTGDYMNHFSSLIIAAVTSIFLEVMPEPLLSWGITGQSMADFFEEARSVVNGQASAIPQAHATNFFDAHPVNSNMGMGGGNKNNFASPTPPTKPGQSFSGGHKPSNKPNSQNSNRPQNAVISVNSNGKGGGNSKSSDPRFQLGAIELEDDEEDWQ